MIKYLVYILYGFFGLSSFFNKYLTELTTFSFVEIAFIPLLITKRREIKKGITVAIDKDGVSLLVCILLLISTIVIGGLYNNSEIRGVFGASRGYLYILLISIYFRNNPLPHVYVIICLTLGALIGDCLLVIKESYWGGMFLVEEGLLFKTNLMALYLCLSGAILSRKISLITLVAVLSVFITVMGAFRINIAVIIIAVVAGIIISIRGVRFFEFISVLCGLSLSSVFGYFTLTYLFDSGILSRYGIFRIVDRTLSIVRGDLYTSQDIYRLQMLNNFVDNSFDCILPRGMMIKNVGGGYNDLPLYELMYVFSLPVGSIILGYLLYKIGKYYIHWFRGRIRIREDSLIFGFSPLVILFLLTNGRFLYIPYESILFAMCLGRLVQRDFSTFYPNSKIVHGRRMSVFHKRQNV